MTTLHYVTYVTHKAGTFDKLINNEYNLKIDVIGWGQKWNGLMDKIVGYLNYCKQRSNDDVVVFLDGFDTIINKDPAQVLPLFKSLNCDILVSYDNKRAKIIDYFVRRIYGSCKNGLTANSGMIMGYVKNLKPLFQYILDTKERDDQVGFNMYCRNNPIANLKIDTDTIIFENISKLREPTAVFLSFPSGWGPGGLSMGYKLNRIYRGMFQDGYIIKLLPEIVLLLIIIYYLKGLIVKITKKK